MEGWVDFEDLRRVELVLTGEGFWEGETEPLEHDDLFCLFCCQFCLSVLFVSFGRLSF